jgi:hydrogenase nickel incorporation protein HypA/HybF
MHEYGIASQLVAAAGRIARENDAVRVSRVVCRVGAFDAVVPAVLREAFAMCAVGSVVEEAELVVEVERFRLHCRNCGRDADADAGTTACPNCGSPDLGLYGEHGLKITSLTVETADENRHHARRLRAKSRTGRRHSTPV